MVVVLPRPTASIHVDAEGGTGYLSTFFCCHIADVDASASYGDTVEPRRPLTCFLGLFSPLLLLFLLPSFSHPILPPIHVSCEFYFSLSSRQRAKAGKTGAGILFSCHRLNEGKQAGVSFSSRSMRPLFFENFSDTSKHVRPTLLLLFPYRSFTGWLLCCRFYFCSF